ncbi:MAG: hypothetical protein HZA46_07045 [Planctomycetales bacterium]|nr:hypothetical protein [Planctomycetales bacterium]
MSRILFLFAVLVVCRGASATEQPAARTLLFVDDHEVLYRAGTRRELHSPVRHDANPLLTGPEPRNQVGYCSVHRDATSGRYQLWYQLTGAGQVVCYAESTDGVKWTKPDLDLITLKGVPDRNVVFTSLDHYGASVVVDPTGDDLQRRYKLAYWSIPPLVGKPAHPKDDRGPDGGMYVAFSPDGKHWTKQPGPVLRGTYGRSQDPPLVGEKYPWGEISSVSDVLDATYDPLCNKFVVHAKAWIDAPDGKLFWKRAIVRTESQDFMKWSPPQLVMVPDEHDGVRPAAYPGTRQGVQLHGAPVFVRHGVYFSLVQVADFETHGLQPIELAISRDGLAWSRPFRATPFLPVGATGTFDAGRIWSNATPVVLDDEIRFYYGAYQHPWKFGKGEYPWNSKTRVPKSGLGLATLPLDRFAGLRPIEKLGQITLRPRSLRGVNELTLNADASTGTIRLELLNATGHRLPGFTKSDAAPVTADGLRHRVTWKTAKLINSPPEDIMIRIHLENAEVFALTLD